MTSKASQSGLSGSTSYHPHTRRCRLPGTQEPHPNSFLPLHLQCSALCLDRPSHLSAPGLANSSSPFKAQHRCPFPSKTFREHQALACNKLLAAYYVQDTEVYSVVTHTYHTPSVSTVLQQTLRFPRGALPLSFSAAGTHACSLCLSCSLTEEPNLGWCPQHLAHCLFSLVQMPKTPQTPTALG